jgi:hypothetical protein
MTDFQITRGDDASLAVALTDAEGNPVDPDTITWAAFTVKRAYRDEDIDALIRKDLGSGISSDGTSLLVAIAAADTAALVVPLALVWDIEVIDDGETHTVAAGILRIVPDVTRSSGYVPGSGS